MPTGRENIIINVTAYTSKCNPKFYNRHHALYFARGSARGCNEAAGVQAASCKRDTLLNLFLYSLLTEKSQANIL